VGYLVQPPAEAGSPRADSLPSYSDKKKTYQQGRSHQEAKCSFLSCFTHLIFPHIVEQADIYTCSLLIFLAGFFLGTWQDSWLKSLFLSKLWDYFHLYAGSPWLFFYFLVLVLVWGYVFGFVGAGPGERNTREGFAVKDMLLDNTKSQLLTWQKDFRVQWVQAEHELPCPCHVPALLSLLVL